MRQALHIFKKDVRYLRYEIALVVAIAVAFAAMHIPAFHQSNNSWFAELALVATAVFLIGRLVLAEAIPGDCQFWITRPYDWRSLLGAKLLFMIAFVNLPVALADLFILMVDGFPILPSLPGLLWSQALLFSSVSLPFAALAALNSGLAAFVFSQLIALAALLGIWQTLGEKGRAFGGVEWLRDSSAIFALAAIAIAVLWLQYKSRRTLLSRWVAIGGLAVAALAFVAMPLPLALAVQSHWTKERAIAASIRVDLGQGSQAPLWVPRGPNVALRMPILVRGIGDGTEIHPDAFTVSLSAHGHTVNLSMADCSDLKRDTISSSEATISTVCTADPAFFQQERGQPVTIRGSLYLTLFGNARSETIPLSNQPANALDGLQCYTDVVKAEWDIYCRSAFRWPARLVYAALGHTNAHSFAQTISYSPFPAALSIDPIETRWASAYAAGPLPTKPIRNVTIMVEEPLAHFRRDFEAVGVPLNEFTLTFLRYLRPQPVR
jgi:hypothetical protein